MKTKMRKKIYLYIIVSLLGIFIFFVHQNKKYIARFIFFQLTDSTQYSVGMDVNEFYKLHKGMSKKEVRMRLGPPLSISTGPVNEQWWSYTKPGSTGNYRILSVLFDASGKSIEIVDEYYFD